MIPVISLSNVGSLNIVVKLRAVVEVIPAYELPAESSKAVAAIKI